MTLPYLENIIVPGTGSYNIYVVGALSILEPDVKWRNFTRPGP